MDSADEPVAAPEAAPAPVSEPEKIEQLLKIILETKGQFVRNGMRHSPEEAVQHLRRKLSGDKASTQSARAFIQRLATRSSFSGEPYLIVFQDGTEIPAGKFLLDRLNELEAVGR